MDKIDKYFKNLSSSKKEKLLMLEDVYHEVNAKINIISRKDIDNIFLHHIIPALSIAKVVELKNKSNILDIGSGGGLPGIPLAIVFDKAQFTLVDSRGKKCDAMREVVTKLKLKNIEIKQIRSNELKKKFNYVVGRAVTIPSSFIDLAKKNLADIEKKESIFYISGGDLDKNLNSVKLSKYFEEEYFDNKYIYVY